MTKYKNKYRIDSARLRNWDYGANAQYFVTICCDDKVQYFGEIHEEKMIFSEIGLIAKKCWEEIPQHFPFVVLHKYIIMPNHVHGIIEIAKSNNGQKNQVNDESEKECNVEMQNFASLPPIQQASRMPSINKFGPQSQNLGSIIRGFKIGVTKNARQIEPEFLWQPRFHDHIVRNQLSFNKITKYILNNPKNWKEDKFYQKGK